MRKMNKYQLVREIARLAKEKEDAEREKEAHANIQSSGILKVNENTPYRNFVAEEIEKLEKSQEGNDDPC